MVSEPGVKEVRSLSSVSDVQTAVLADLLNIDSSNRDEMGAVDLAEIGPSRRIQGRETSREAAVE